MSTVPNAHIKTLFTVKFRTTGVNITGADLINPDMAAEILPVLNGTDTVQFIDGLLRVVFTPDNWFYQPHQVDHVTRRELTTFMRSVIKPYILSDNAFGYEILEVTYNHLDPEQQWPTNLARL